MAKNKLDLGFMRSAADRTKMGLACAHCTKPLFANQMRAHVHIDSGGGMYTGEEIATLKAIYDEIAAYQLCSECNELLIATLREFVGLA